MDGKKKTLLAAHGAEVKLKAEGEREAKAQHVPKVPTPEEIQQHNLTHEPYKGFVSNIVPDKMPIQRALMRMQDIA